jgi:hypothetical protein
MSTNITTPLVTTLGDVLLADLPLVDRLRGRLTSVRVTTCTDNDSPATVVEFTDGERMCLACGESWGGPDYDRASAWSFTGRYQVEVRRLGYGRNATFWAAVLSRDEDTVAATTLETSTPAAPGDALLLVVRQLARWAKNPTGEEFAPAWEPVIREIDEIVEVAVGLYA